MNKKELEEEDEQDIDEILGEDDDEEEEDDEEEVEEKPKIVKKIKSKKSSEVKSKVLHTDEYKWKPFIQQAFEGYQNSDTGEIIGSDDVIRRILCYAEEAAKNTR